LSLKTGNSSAKPANLADRDLKKALNYAFLLLKYRARSKSEITSRLQKKKFDKVVIAKALNYLEEKKYINDKEFADSFAASRRQRGWGPKKILCVLQRLEIDTCLAQAALGQSEDFKRQIKELIEKKAGCYKGPFKRQKLLRFLSSRGFFSDDIQEVLEEIEIK